MKAALHVHVGIAGALPLAVVWIAFSMYQFCGLLYGAYHLRKLLGRAVDASLPPEIAMWLGAYFTVRSVRVKASDEIDRPSVVGYVRPVILLPTGFLSGISDGDLRRILLHEAEHVRGFDDCVNLLQKAGVALFPLNPALRWMECRLCLERELSCDDAVLESTGAPKAYAMCLTQIAENRLRSRAALLAVAAFGQRPDLSNRVMRILQWSPRQASGWVYGATSALLLCGLGAGIVGLQRFGLQVAFEDAPVLIGSAADVRPPTNGTSISASNEVVQESVPAGLAQTNFYLPTPQFRSRKQIHLNRSAVKRSRVQPDLAHRQALTHGSVKVQQPVEQLIEYVPAPVEREQAPVLQQISIPYAVIPAGDVWLIVQL